ncbi:MAG: peptidoglycan DD-metalloendopeptidase family protein [Desulfopila sp.]
MREHFDIIIAGDQHRPRSFRISKGGIILTAATIFTISGILFSTAFFTTGLYSHNKLLTRQMASTKAEMRRYQAVNTKLQAQLSQKDRQSQNKIAALQQHNNRRIAALNTQHSRQVSGLETAIQDLKKRQTRRLAQLQSEYSGKIEKSRKTLAALNDTNDRHLATLQHNHSRQLDTLKDKYSSRISDLKNQYNQQIEDLKHTLTTKIARLEMQNMQQRLSFKKEKEELLSTAVDELHSRSAIIEDIISDIGITLKPAPESSASGSGGPFVAADNSNYDELIYHADNYLETLKILPLGKPVQGSVSSWFGKRKDPLNQKEAFHEGIDFRGRKGDPILATGNGKVVFVGTNGGYGKVVKIDHGNGYTSSFAHMDSFDVADGDYVERGQRIGKVGNSGRSTGSHLHYELNYRGRPANPYTFMKVADKTYQYTTLSEKQECSAKKKILRKKSKKLKVKPSPQS